ncbi:hypothetical protein [Staphylococcus caledonicus]|uniref:hypothetical protein n=1 Tax=Staphylococcus caledonicus TaxID=2741333 RepID=UPI0018E4B4D2|nr:hypothetical protein [Staphylococcus caledonicus]MBI5973935.1 hypothetical protein [Staphylococcus caledonicus]
MIKLPTLKKHKSKSKDKMKEAKKKEADINTAKDSKKSKDKKLSKRAKKKEVKRIRDLGTEYAPSSGYVSTASIMKSGNRYGTVFKVINTYGMNRNQQLGWAYKLIPPINVEGVRGYLFVETKPFSKKEQSHYFKNIVPETQKSYKTNETGNVDSATDEKRRKARLQDIRIAEELHGEENIALDLHLHVLIVGDNPDNIEEQIRRLNNSYSKRISGVKLMSVAGVQEQMFRELLLAKEGKSSNYTMMSTLYGGFDHVLRRGLNDKDGLPIGELSDSYTKGQAFMALNNTFKRRVVVASHKESRLRGFNSKMSSSSLWGQLIANNAMMYGNRTFHIVLNGHRYYGDVDRTYFSCPPSLNKKLQYIDLAKGGLNPIQMFGDTRRKDDKAYITNIFDNNIKKLYQITYLLGGRRLRTEREDLIMLLEKFYRDSKVWNRDYPLRSRLIGISEPETVKTMGSFILTLNNYQKSVRENPTSTEEEINNAKHLYQTVQSALNTHSQLFNTVTTLPSHKDNSKLQWYYDVSNINNPDVREAQFVNAFDYCTYTAAPNDIVMIHGVDKISVETLKVLKPTLEQLSDRGVRLAYLFDTIGSGEVKDDVLKADIFNTDGILYQDFEQQFDYTILGTMSQADLAHYESKVRQQLNDELRSALIRNNPVQYQIRRTGDLTSNIIRGEFIL